MGYDELVNELAELSGILPEYWDILGNRHVTSADTKKAILRAMKFKTGSADEITKAISEMKAGPWKTFIEPVHVVSVNNQPFSIPVYIPVREGDETKLTISCSLQDEGRRKERFDFSADNLHISEEKWIENTRYVRVDLVDRKSRDIGYYTLLVTCGDRGGVGSCRTRVSGKTRVIITPDTCFMPDDLMNGRAWGVSVNLYSVRSKRNWGIGDFRDLGKLVKWTAQMRGHFIGINPLHSLPNTRPFGVSPYSPVSRLYKNFVYLDVENVQEVKESGEGKKIRASKRLCAELRGLRKTEFIDYERIAQLKERILKKAFAFFYRKHFLKKTARALAFSKYAEDEGLCLKSFAVFMSLQKYMMKNKKAFSWQEWPEAYRKMSGRKVAKFAKENRREILYYQYVQWLIDGQINKAALKSKNSGLNVGLYHDLAVGSMGGGSDAWSFHDVIASGVDAGAPPDDFSPDGQKWGFPPIIPGRLKESGYELFIQTIKKNMRHFGALRIDHALGMFRLFWIPEGMTPNDGAYVSYPSEDLLRIIALESVRNRTTVIAEDLGTIGEHVRDALKRLGLFSYRLFYFERNYPDPSFRSPDAYPLMALCAVTTHDLPTIYGYWKGRDLEKRRAIGKYPDDSLWNRQVEERERDKALILSALKSRGLVTYDYPSDPAAIPEMTPELCRAIYHYLAQTPCKLLLVSLEDILGVLDQQNMPGTVDSHPNWVQKTPLDLEEIVKDRRFLELSGMLNKYFI